MYRPACLRQCEMHQSTALSRYVPEYSHQPRHAEQIISQHIYVIDVKMFVQLMHEHMYTCTYE